LDYQFLTLYSPELKFKLIKFFSINIVNIYFSDFFQKGGEIFMNFLVWIIFGALAGWIASLVMKSDKSQGAVMNIIVGIVGAVIGGFIMNALGYSGVSGFNLYSVLVAVFGASILIWAVRAFA
jgi:uncharacterized membrane protein YeaQ/YmgE (transglycosylase-associated protein family)